MYLKKHEFTTLANYTFKKKKKKWFVGYEQVDFQF